MGWEWFANKRCFYNQWNQTIIGDLAGWWSKILHGHSLDLKPLPSRPSGLKRSTFVYMMSGKWPRIRSGEQRSEFQTGCTKSGYSASVTEINWADHRIGVRYWTCVIKAHLLRLIVWLQVSGRHVAPSAVTALIIKWNDVIIVIYKFRISVPLQWSPLPSRTHAANHYSVHSRNQWVLYCPKYRTRTWELLRGMSTWNSRFVRD